MALFNTYILVLGTPKTVLGRHNILSPASPITPGTNT